MTNFKTILTLAAIASLSAALVPTGASAFFARGGNHSASFGGHFNSHPVNFGRGHNAGFSPVSVHRPQFHAGWHPTVSRNPGWHRQYGWHERPVEIDVVREYARPHYVAPRVVAYPAAPTYVAPAYAPKPQAAVNGQNVVLVEVPNAQFTMVAQGKWVKQGANGEHFEFTEDSRDERSVYLTDASRGVSLQLDLSQKQVYLLGTQPKRPVFPIVNVSATVRGG
jgi:hypothetical protein